MSGIAGIIHFDGTTIKPGLIQQMTDAISHRGPDGIHHWSKGSVALGQCMLHTTPESLSETQPLTNEDENLVLVMDGRVDNYIELRKKLLKLGVTLRNNTDAELVLKSYELWRNDCTDHIEGDFAFLVWDILRQEAFCARDRIGNKPFYYHWNGNTFSFASELHSILLLPWVSEELNEGMVAEHLACEWISLDETFWIGIMRLVASHNMVLRSNGIDLKKYWKPILGNKLEFTKEEEYIEHNRSLFIDIVKRMSRSQSPIACEVSGGLDSSSIFSIAHHLDQNNLLKAPAFDGYTLDFNDNVDANELEYAREVGKHCKKKISEILPSIKSINWYQQWAERYRTIPPYPNGVMGMNIRATAVSNGSKVLMTGVGGDEWLWGNRTYYAELVANSEWGKFFQCFKTDYKDAGLIATLGWIARFGFFPFLPKSIKSYLRSSKRSFNAKQFWLTPEIKKILQQRRLKFANTQNSDEAYIGYNAHLSTLNSAYGALSRESEEQLAATIGIELRRPFWDPKMVQFAFDTPLHWKLRGNSDRVIHRRSMQGLIPEKILQRTTKANFMITYQNPLQGLFDDLKKRTSIENSSWVNQQEVNKLWNEWGLIDNGGWSEFRLLTLFGCDCLANSFNKQIDNK